VSRQELDALKVLSDQPFRLTDHMYNWTSGWHEKGAKTAGLIRWETAIPPSWDEVILQGPHFTVATPFAKQPNEECRSKSDYSDWDLETLGEHVMPRTNYQRACDRDTYEANLARWAGKSNTDYWRVAWRRMSQPGRERSLHAAFVARSASHVGTVCTAALGSTLATARLAGLMASVPFDYLVKTSSRSDLWFDVLARFPVPREHELDRPLLARLLRLTCLTADFSPLWADLWDAGFRKDRWTDPTADRITLGETGPTWTMDTSLRRDFERRLALVEIDALAALMLGLTAEQVCAMYRTQFAVLRKYEYAMAFDSEGRKICAHHQSAGYRQAQLQQDAKDKKRAPHWKSVWKMLEQWEEDPDSVDWEGQYFPPFTRPDREAEMTRAYNEFQRRLDAGEYG